MRASDVTPIEVQVVVKVGDQTKVYEAAGGTTSSPWDVAAGMLNGLTDNARKDLTMPSARRSVWNGVGGE